MTQFLFRPLLVYRCIIVVIIVSFCLYISFRSLFQYFFLLKFVRNLLFTGGKQWRYSFFFCTFLKSALVLCSFPSFNGMYAGSPVTFLQCVRPVGNGERHLSILSLFSQGTRGRSGKSGTRWPAAVHMCSRTRVCAHNWWLIEHHNWWFIPNLF